MDRHGQKPNREQMDKDQGKQQRHNMDSDMSEPDQKPAHIGDNPDETRKKVPNMGNNQ